MTWCIPCTPFPHSLINGLLFGGSLPLWSAEQPANMKEEAGLFTIFYT